MEHEAFWARLFNQYIADPTARLLGFRLPPGHHALPDHIVMIIYIMVILIGLSLYVRRRLSVDNPGVLQQFFEVAFGAISNLMREIIGHDAQRFFPLIGGLALFILCGNLLGLLPGFMSPTSNINVTLGLAIVSFSYYNWQGVKKHGVLRYLKHFAGPTLALAPILFLIEIISHCARIVSLSVRLYGNILSEELIIGVLTKYIFPFIVPLPVMLLALFASTIQAFIFILLSMVYISGAIESSHDHEGEPAHAHEGFMTEPA